MCSFCNHKTVIHEDRQWANYLLSIMDGNTLSVHKKEKFPAKIANFTISYCPYCGKKLEEK